MTMFKKITAFVLATATIMTSSASAFTFPTPDWGALLEEKTQMVSETDFELYTEGSLNSAVYYGAKNEPRAGAYIGMVTENSTQFAPISSYLTYIEEMNQPDFYYPANTMIRDGNSVVMVGWSIYNLDSVDYNHIRSVLNTLSTYNKPMFIRFANEMNVSALGDDPTKYVNVFRNVANIVHEYPNFAMVWSPNDLGALDRPFKYFYPGDEYVDWIGVSSYMKKYFMGQENTALKDTIYFMTGDYAWATNALKPIVKFMAENNINKPLMISEGGVSTNTKFGEVSEDWASPRLRNMLWNVIMKYPQVKMINYFNTNRPYEVERYDISGKSYAEDIFKEAVQSGAYLRTADDQPQFIFKKATDGHILTADNDGYVPLYTLAYDPENPNTSVNYFIDNEWKHSSGNIPYKYYMNLFELSDGPHTLKITSAIGEKSYKMNKTGNFVSFTDMSGATTNATANNDGKNIGDVIDTIYTTDILTYVDDTPIRGYAINGKTMICLEDLRDYGFTVNYDDSVRTLYVDKTSEKSPDFTPFFERGVVGGVAGDVLKTDIKAYVNGVRANAYAIDGRMVAAVEDLGTTEEKPALSDNENPILNCKMSYTYNDFERALRLYTK